MHILSVHWQSVWLNLRLTSQRWGRSVALRTGGCCRTATFAKHRGSSRNAGPSFQISWEPLPVCSREKPDLIASLASTGCGQASKNIRARKIYGDTVVFFNGFERRLVLQVLNEVGTGASRALVCWVSVWPRLQCTHVQTSFCLLFGIWARPEAWPAWRLLTGNEASMVLQEVMDLNTNLRKSIKVLNVYNNSNTSSVSTVSSQNEYILCRSVWEGEVIIILSQKQ